MSDARQAVDTQPAVRWVRFVEEIKSDDVVLMSFKDPAPGFAVLLSACPSEAREDRLDILEMHLLPLSAGAQTTPEVQGVEKDGPAAAPPIFVRYRGVELTWRPGHAVLQCDPEQAELLFAAVVDFSYYERALRRIEKEIADGWVELEEDKPLAFEVAAVDLRRSKVVGRRMNRVFHGRIRHVRIEPHLYAPEARLPAVSRKLGEEMREKARTEARLETVDGQLEVFEHLYEMISQRLGEFRASRQAHIVEWIIIVLLAAETLLMLAANIWKVKG